ncbi:MULTISPECIES: GTP-binding protein [Paracoccus]|jgi:G3E family GTPase|uniref:GTP-binding protein n=1 Tax=Paracoccus TaxID=265 RepID=UPI0025888ED5|nr:GTP-binding protein [Paracoccus sp. (in: a-proteobacteria)]
MPLFSPRLTVAQVEEGHALAPKFDAAGLIPVVTTDAATGEVLMMGVMNAEALTRSIATGEAHYWSRETQSGGRPHAERVALNRAGAAARGATLYVTLESCCHWGKTPPCADAIIAAGVTRVVAAMQDPDPRVNGGGFARAVDKVTGAGATHLLETSGSTHPWPLLEAIRTHPALRLHGFLSVVDTVTLAQDHDLGRAILPAASRHLAEGRRGIENLLAEQIMFASRILLSKMDRVCGETLRTVAQAIHPLNPFADIMGMQWGNVRLADVLALPPYDHARVAGLGAELTDWDRSRGTASMSGAEGYRLGSIVIADPRPFHPQRLWRVYNHALGTGIHRSKGFFWLPSRDRLQLLWNQTAGSIGLEIVNYWKIAALEDAGGRKPQPAARGTPRDAPPPCRHVARVRRPAVPADRDRGSRRACGLRRCGQGLLLHPCRGRGLEGGRSLRRSLADKHGAIGAAVSRPARHCTYRAVSVVLKRSR